MKVETMKKIYKNNLDNAYKNIIGDIEEKVKEGALFFTLKEEYSSKPILGRLAQDGYIVARYNDDYVVSGWV